MPHIDSNPFRDGQTHYRVVKESQIHHYDFQVILKQTLRKYYIIKKTSFIFMNEQMTMNE